jgi:hypothetical protein
MHQKYVIKMEDTQIKHLFAKQFCLDYTCCL